MTQTHPWWLWPNLFSLDAPVVAVVWQQFLGVAADVEVPVAASAVLGQVVWAVYLADRWLDARRECRHPTDRHRFAARNPRIVVLLAAIALLSAAFIAALALPLAYLQAGGLVAAALSGYLLSVHLIRLRRAAWRGLKESTVGIVFAAGVAVPLIAAANRTAANWLPGVAAFAGLCGLNCMLISWWEEPPFIAPPGWAALAAALLAVGASLGAPLPVAAAVLTSVGLLAALHLARPRFSPRSLRVLADAALLTPLAAVAFT